MRCSTRPYTRPASGVADSAVLYVPQSGSIIAGAGPMQRSHALEVGQAITTTDTYRLSCIHYIRGTRVYGMFGPAVVLLFRRTSSIDCRLQNEM